MQQGYVSSVILPTTRQMMRHLVCFFRPAPDTGMFAMFPAVLRSRLSLLLREAKSSLVLLPVQYQRAPEDE